MKNALCIFLFLLCVPAFSDLDDIIAVYDFESLVDLGPNGFDGETTEGAVVHDGVLVADNRGFFSSDNKESPLEVENNFTVASWVKTENHSGVYIIGVASFSGIFLAGHFSIQVDTGHIVSAIFTFDGFQIIDREILGIRNIINDGKWHHIIFTATDDHYRVYIDGEMIKQSNNDRQIGFSGETTFVKIGNFGGIITKEVHFNDVVLLKEGLGEHGVNVLYRDGLDALMGALGIESRSMATTWAEIKSR